MNRLLLTLLLLAAPVAADTLTVRQLVNGVDGVCDDRESMACAYYFIGVLDGYAATPGKPVFCPPPEETTRQLVRVALKYMEQYPERRAEPAAAVAMAAWAAAFPCPSE